MKKKIGIITAIEINAIFTLYKNYKEIETNNMFKLYVIENDKYDLYVLQTGMGEVKASAGCQFLISKYDVSMIVNFGVVGGLTNEMKQMKICLVDKVVHYKYDCSEFMNLKVGQVDGHDSIYLYTDKKIISTIINNHNYLNLVTCCSGDKFISTAIEKEYLHKTFNGDICDMESAGIVLTCEINNIPCVLFKAVSDGLSDGAKGFYQELENASLECLKIVKQTIEQII